MTIRALVPVKTLSTAKSRLAPYLPLREREILVLDMLHHVIRALQESERLEQISVVSPDEQVLERVQAWGAQALHEELPGHNTALHVAALREMEAAYAQEEPLEALLTISADLPLLHPGDIRLLIEKTAHYPVVLAPARDRTGTNALLVRPPLALPYLFGPNSLQRYQQAARQWQLNSTLYSSIGLALDIDTIDDLDDLHELQVLSGEQSQSWQFALCSPQL